MVKNKNKQKKILYVGIIFITIIASLVLLGTNQVREQTFIQKSEQLGDVTITIQEYYGLGKIIYFFKTMFKPLVVTVTPNTVVPGETYTVKFFGGIPTSCVPKSGFFYIKDNTWAIIDYKSSQLWGGLPAAGTSTIIITNFNAPQVVGTYTALFSLYNTILSSPVGSAAQYICFSDYIDFNVQAAAPVSCPANNCESWVFLTNVLHGSIYERWCHNFGSPPKCIDSPSYASKTVCDPDYKLTNGVCVRQLYCGDGTCNNGETCTSCSDDCGACAVEKTCYYCDASNKVASIKVSSSTCGAGMSSTPDIPNCGVNNPPENNTGPKNVTCYFCDRAQGIITPVQLLACQGEFYSTQAAVGVCQKEDTCANVNYNTNPSDYCVCKPGDSLCKPSENIKQWYETYWYLLAGGGLILILLLYYYKGGKRK